MRLLLCISLLLCVQSGFAASSLQSQRGGPLLGDHVWHQMRTQWAGKTNAAFWDSAEGIDTNGWLFGVDTSAISMRTAPSYRTLVLIAPKYATLCNHSPIATNELVIFRGTNGVFHTNRVVALASIGTNDLMLATLVTNVPSTVNPAYLFPSDWLTRLRSQATNVTSPFDYVDYMDNVNEPTPFTGTMPVVMLEQNTRKALPTLFSFSVSRSTNTYTGSTLMLGDASVSSGSGASWNGPAVLDFSPSGGSSSSPVVTLFQNKLILLYHLQGPLGGPNVSFAPSLAWLQAQISPQTLSFVSLAGTPSFSSDVNTNPPTITVQPQTVTMKTNESSPNFTVTATGAPTLAYQWQTNGVNVSGSHWSNVTTPSMNVNNALITDSNLQVRVIITNLYGSVTSSVVALIVTNGVGGACDTLSTDTNTLTGLTDINVALSAGTDYAATYVDSTSAETICAVSLYLKKVGTPTFDLTAEIWSYNGGANTPGTFISASSAIASSTFTTSYVYYKFTGLSWSKSASTRYAIVIRRTSGATDGSNYVQWDSGNVGDQGHDTVWNSSDGSTWNAVDIANLNQGTFILWK